MTRGPQSAPIYVEIRIHGDLADLWEKTQDPKLHERWDLRFTKIDYLPQEDPSKPQRFRYSRNFGFMTISGVGETVGERRRSDGSATSALKFWSDDSRSLIREGSGYWRYVPTEDGIRFLTRYDYEVRFGAAGRWVDRVLWRPLMGWGTAWSFDRLRIWLEEGISPERSLKSAFVYQSSRLSLAATWLYQGLVPKLIVKDSGELEILSALRLFDDREPLILSIVGLGEAAFGAMMLALPRARWPFALNLVALPALAAGAWLSRRDIFTKLFNPASLTIAMMALAVIGCWTSKDVPTADNCQRDPPGQEV